jgi:hypothetical protein
MDKGCIVEVTDSLHIYERNITWVCILVEQKVAKGFVYSYDNVNLLEHRTTVVTSCGWFVSLSAVLEQL